MPNRILKESICTSESLSELTDFEENFFYKLIVNCDDYGRFDARPAILKSRCYPLKERLSHTTIENALSSLARVGCVELYNVDGKPYLRLPTWEAHQQVRAKKSKYPSPDSNGNQMISNDFICSRNPIQYESESELQHGANIAPCGNSVITLTLNNKSEYPIYEEQVHEWADLYPAVDVMQQLRNMKGWLDANPKKRKTHNGILKFIVGWLSREQDRGGLVAVVENKRDLSADFQKFQNAFENLQ